jgi:hypothetical protein
VVPDAPLQIRHRGSVVACPDLVSGHCCMVEGMTKKYQQLSYNVSPHTYHHSPYPHPCRVAMAGAHTTGVVDNRAEIWLGMEIGVWRARCSSWKAVEVSGTCSS